MKNALIVTAFVFLIIISFSISSAGNINPTGNWKFTLYESSVSGMCPMGRDGKGSLVITKRGNRKYTLKYVKGMTCDPNDVCVLKGSCEGAVCIFSTTVTVDNEGGSVTNSNELRFDGGVVRGAGQSVYKHPSGMTCSWTYKLTLDK